MIVNMFGISLPHFIYCWVVKREYALQIYIFDQAYMINPDTRAQQRLSANLEGTASCAFPERAGVAPDCFWMACFHSSPWFKAMTWQIFIFPLSIQAKAIREQKEKTFWLSGPFHLAGSGGKSIEAEKKKSLFFRTVNSLRELICKKSGEAEQNVNFAGWERFIMLL